MKIHLLLFSAELSIMRSAFSTAQAHLTSAITTARTHAGLWDSFAGRITLDMGLLRQASGDEKEAEECFETVLMSGEGREEGGEEGASLVTLAKVSLLVLKISQGSRVRLSTSFSSISSSSPSSTNDSARLTSLARSVVEATQDAAPALRLTGEFVQALTRGEITKAKQHLSVALNLSNTSLANHAKALMLALLANLFLHTRNDQVGFRCLFL
jgi:hypothetical protein